MEKATLERQNGKRTLINCWWQYKLVSTFLTIKYISATKLFISFDSAIPLQGPRLLEEPDDS